MAANPSKSDISTIFKRLRSVPTNKQCFDCGSLNPTWASITYGVFLCIDCSAVHRSLGVHVSFIRSSQLDTNWSWLQLRAMQVGGNANAISFFSQHGYTSTDDAQRKYHSRAANMYREKLHTLANQAMRLHGTTVLDLGTEPPSPSPQDREADFFKEHVDDIIENTSEMTMSEAKHPVSEPLPIKNGNSVQPVIDPSEGPSVEDALSMSPTQAIAQAEPRKPTIGSSRKPASAKKGKGLGAQKVKTNFTEIESRAQQLDKERDNLADMEVRRTVANKEDEQKRMASMRLAYQDMSVERKKQEEKLKSSDPKKAEQLERLGMGGFGGNRDISHSAISEMKTIDQVTPSLRSDSDRLDRYEKSSSRKDFFEDELEMIGGFSSGPPRYDSPFNSKNDPYGSWGGGRSRSGGSNIGSGGGTSSWDMDRFESNSDANNGFSVSDSPSKKPNDRSSRKSSKLSDNTDSSDTAQKKFGNVKSISSDQYFGNRDPDFEVRQNLQKYEGSSSISSSDLFGTGDGRRSDADDNSPDLGDIKEGVRQGVTKVAGKLSSMANGLMSSLQERYSS